MLILTAICLATAEVALRLANFQPTVQDSPMLWSQQRARLDDPLIASHALVFLGRSRIMQAIDRPALERRYPLRPPLQLAIAGNDRHPIATLQDIAEKTSFSGVLVVGVTEESFEKLNWAGQADLVDHYHHRFGLNDSINERISVLMQEQFAFLRPEVTLRALATTLLRRRELPTPSVEMDRYRFRNTELRNTEFNQGRLAITRQRLQQQIDSVITGRIEKPDPATWLQDALAVEPWVERIQQRGGRVVYLRMPTAGEFLTLGDMLYPRQRFWRVLAAETSAGTVHFGDYPTLSTFELPDLSHVRGEDRVGFTTALMDILEEMGVLEG